LEDLNYKIDIKIFFILIITTIMTRTIEMNNIIEERYQFCVWLYRIKKETDKRNKLKRERGDENVLNFDLFTCPVHIQKLFGDFLKTPQYTELATLRGHTGEVHCLAFHDNKLYSGGGYRDRTIRIWNTETYEQIAVLEGGEEMSNIIINDNKMYVAFKEERSGRLMNDVGELLDDDVVSFGYKTIRIWNTDTFEEIATLRGHKYGKVCITIHNNKLFSGGGDNTIRVWNTETYEQIATWEGHNRWVECLTIHDNKLYSVGDDKTIRIWNTETYEKITTLRGHKKSVNCLTHDGNKLFSGSNDKTIRIWNTETYKTIATLRGHTHWVYCLTHYENKLYSGSWDKTIRIWNTETYEQIATLIHTGDVMCLTLHENKLFSGSVYKTVEGGLLVLDGTIRVWKI
jgi:F-box/WD-40 domain protein 7